MTQQTDPPEALDAPRRNVLDLIADLRSGVVSPRGLSAEDRRACVAYLHPEGVSLSEMSRLLGRTERTIARDLAEIRADNAVRVDQEFVAEQVGALLHEARACISRIRRATRDRETPSAVRVDGERAIFDIADRVTARLQSLGYLPTVGHRVQADVTCHVADSRPLAALVAELQHLADIASSSVGVPTEISIELGEAAGAARDLSLPSRPTDPEEAVDDHNVP